MSARKVKVATKEITPHATAQPDCALSPEEQKERERERERGKEGQRERERERRH